jgi:hypothetical protein
MYAFHRQSYSPSLIDNPATGLWLSAFYAQLDTPDVQPISRHSRQASSAQSSSPRRLDPATASPPATDPSPILPIHDGREHVKARFRLLRRLLANHDNEGAEAANPKSVDTAIAFIDSIEEPFPSCLATLDDDGSAVIEFEDEAKGFIADLTFRGDGTNIECYRRQAGMPSEFFEGALNSTVTHNFIKNYLCLTY